MKTSPSIPETKARLSERYGLSDAQAQAIVEMTLGRLTGMEREKIEEELARLEALVADLKDILANPERIKQIIREEMTAIRDKYGDDRRTEILEATDEIDLEDLIERHNCIITVSHAGYVKRQASDVYSAQNRGGKGIIGATTKEEDFIETVLSVCSHDMLLLFTNHGKVYARKAYMIPEASRTSKGSNIVNIVELSEGEKLTSMIAVSEFTENEYLTMVTKMGVIKKTSLSDFEYNRKGGKKAIELDEGDELYFVRKTDGNNSILIATEDGQSVRFDENNVRGMGRAARGVRALRLRGEDKVTGVAVVEEGKKLLTITENGFGKKTEFEDFREMKNRGGMGVTCHKLSEKTGKLVGIATVSEDEDIMLITHGGTIIRVRAADISTYSRTASGVTVMRTRDDTVVSFTVVPAAETDETEAAETEAPATEE
jgi:DNA gyrase subunit A